MRPAHITRFFTTLVFGIAGAFVVGGLLAAIVADLVDIGGWESLGLLALLMPLGFFFGSCLGNWIGGVLHQEEKERRRRQSAPVRKEALCFSIGISVPWYLQLSGGPFGELGAYALVFLGGVGGFALGVHLAESKTVEPEERTRPPRPLREIRLHPNPGLFIRFCFTAVAAGLGLVVGGFLGFFAYEAFGDPDGFQSFAGALVGGPIGVFVGAFLGNWGARKLRKAAMPERPLNLAPSVFESVGLSVGVVIPLLIRMGGVLLGTETVWALVILFGVIGFSVGALLAPSDTLGSDGDRSGDLVASD